MFTTKSDGNFHEDDFKMISDFGFDFVRLPLCYLLWIENTNVFAIRELTLKKLDKAVEFGLKHNIHVNLSFHRAPGFSVNKERIEPFNLWKDEEALDAFIFHWEMIVKRYKGISSERLSINLVNEPEKPSEETMTVEDHERVIRSAVKAIREIDPGRLIIIDGLTWATKPCPELADLGVSQSMRAYAPMGISHYKAAWMVNWQEMPEPSWPGAWHFEEIWDRNILLEHFQPWADLLHLGVGVHCGEGGCYRYTPHNVFLNWFQDVLEILTMHNIGYALWNFRGSFGILDSGRNDVDYENYHGHLLDRKLLNLLQKF
jgi:endoglucanase